MKKLLATMFLSTALITGGITMAETQENITDTQTTPAATQEFVQPFAKGELNPFGKFFTGTTYLGRLVEKDDIWNSSIANVTFEPKARTNWHKHSGGQILLVTAGEGRYQEKGKEARILKKGDVVKIPPETEHWHGAAPDSMFAHISIEPNIPNNETTWLEPVTDKEYYGE